MSGSDHKSEEEITEPTEAHGHDHDHDHDHGDHGPGFEPDEVPVGLLLTVAAIVTIIVGASFIAGHAMVVRNVEQQRLAKGYSSAQVEKADAHGKADTHGKADAHGAAPAAAPAAPAEPAAATTAPAEGSAEPWAEGKALFNGAGACMACHSVDGSPLVGPTLKGKWGIEEELEDGTKVKVDAAYIKESIQTPNAKVVKGFPPAMTPRPDLTDAQIAALTAYIEHLGQ